MWKLWNLGFGDALVLAAFRRSFLWRSRHWTKLCHEVQGNMRELPAWDTFETSDKDGNGIYRDLPWATKFTLTSLASEMTLKSNVLQTVIYNHNHTFNITDNTEISDCYRWHPRQQMATSCFFKKLSDVILMSSLRIGRRLRFFLSGLTALRSLGG